MNKNEFKKEIIEHLNDCLDFDGMHYNPSGYLVECSCGKSWSLIGLNSIEKDIVKFTEGAAMFSHSIREEAKRRNVPIEDVIIPLLGWCVDEIDFEEEELEEPDVELF